MRKVIPLNGLRAFEAAARHMSFQRAANELAVTTTAISHQIRQLEGFLGVALFRRRPRPITLTDAGSSLFPRVQSALDSLDNAVRAVRPERHHQKLTVSMTNAFATHWLIPRLGHFHERHPEITVNVHASESVADLEQGEIDCAVRYVDTLPEDMICSPLFRDNFLPVCAPGVFDTELPAEDLRQFCRSRLLNFEWKRNTPDNPTWSRWFDSIGKRLEIPPECAPETGVWFSEESHAVQGAIQGQGIALCSTVITAEYIKNRQLAIAFNHAIPGYMSALVYPPSSRQRKPVVLFRKWLESESASFRADNYDPLLVSPA